MKTYPLPEPGKAVARESRYGMRDWDFDFAAIERAVEELGIKQPVRVWQSQGKQTRGTWRFRRTSETNAGQGFHACYASRYATPEQASLTLWHELVHAMQMERAGTRAKFDAIYDRETRTRGYKRNRYEVEANRVAAAWNKQFRLTVTL